MGTFDSMLVKYGATLVGYFILGLPIFFPETGHMYKDGKPMDTGNITKYNTINSNLLIIMSKVKIIDII